MSERSTPETQKKAKIPYEPPSSWETPEERKARWERNYRVLIEGLKKSLEKKAKTK